MDDRDLINWQLKKGLKWIKVSKKEEEDKFQANGIRDYELLSDYVIEKTKLCYSKADDQIWGKEDGVISPIKKLDLYVKRFLISEVGNIKPSVPADFKNYLEGSIKGRSFIKNKFAISFKNTNYDVNEKCEINLMNDEVNQNTIPHNLISEQNIKTTHKDEVEFLNKIILSWAKGDEEVVKELYELIGLSMIKYMSIGKAFFLVGNGANGKSWYMNWLVKILGSNNISLQDLKDLTTNKFASAELYSKLANINFDISSEMINDTSMFKRIATGDWITGEYKGKDQFRFASYATPIFGANNIPYMREGGGSDGSKRRMKIIKFNSKFRDISEKEKIEMEEMLMSEKVVEVGIYNGIKAIENALVNGFTESKVSKASLKEHNEKMNHLIHFVEENKIANGMQQLKLFKKYKDWCSVYGHKPFGITQFTERYIAVCREKGYDVSKETRDIKGNDRHVLIVNGRLEE